MIQTTSARHAKSIASDGWFCQPSIQAAKIILGSSLLMLSIHVSAATIVYSERNIFNANTANNIVDGYESETYGWNPGNPYSFVQLTDAAMNAASPEATYTTQLNSSYVGFTYTYQPDGGAYCTGCNTEGTIGFENTSIGTSDGVYAVGLDIIKNGASSAIVSPPQHRNAFVTFGDGSIIEYILPSVETAESPLFWGITSNSLIASIRFGESGAYSNVTSLVIDNLTVAASPVPVPAAIWLLGSGLLCLVGISVRRTGR